MAGNASVCCCSYSLVYSLILFFDSLSWIPFPACLSLKYVQDWAVVGECYGQWHHNWAAFFKSMFVQIQEYVCAVVEIMEMYTQYPWVRFSDCRLWSTASIPFKCIVLVCIVGLKYCS